MGSNILRTEKLCKSFSTGGNMQHVLKNLDITIKEHDFTVIMGSSGSGKSTLLYALSGMDKPSLGKVYFGEQEISEMDNDEMAVLRREHCGFVFQGIYLLEQMNVLDNILAAAYLTKGKRKEKVKEAKELLKEVGIDEKMWKKYPNQLSGGECQRVGIVRALINQPDILFADEPTGALNSSSGQDVLECFSRFHKRGQSIVAVTHDVKTALRGSRVLYLKDGMVYGDLNLGEYEGGDLSRRRKKLNNFLEEMGW